MMGKWHALSDGRSVQADYINSRCRALLNHPSFSFDNLNDIQRIKKFMRDRKIAYFTWYDPINNVCNCAVALPTKPKPSKIKEASISELTAVALVGVMLADLGDARSKMYV